MKYANHENLTWLVMFCNRRPLRRQIDVCLPTTHLQLRHTPATHSLSRESEKQMTVAKVTFCQQCIMMTLKICR